MEKEWQICELEDGSKSFIEFTVSAVPDIWIFERHGTMWCYWPKTSALKKIKSFEQPQTSRNWTTYKCRILMNEEKFSTYEAALQAEKHCQNFSTLIETENEDIQQEDVCNSTMDFDVSWFMEDDDMSNEETTVVGNDSFTYNKEMAKGGPYCLKNETIHSGGHFKFYCNDEASEKSVGDDLDFLGKSECSNQSNITVDALEINDADDSDVDYSNQFKDVDGICTSTMMEVEDERKIDTLQKDDSEALVSKISKIETSLLSFVNVIQKDFYELKEITKSISKKQDIEHGSCRQIFNDNINFGKLLAPRENGSATTNEQSIHNEASNGSGNTSIAQEVIKTVAIVNDPPREITNASAQIGQEVTKKVDIVNGSLSGEIHNRKPETDQAMSNGSLQIAQIIEDAEIICAPLELEICNKETKIVYASGKQVMRLPVINPDHYKENEDLLGKMEVETALIEYLSPLENEDEASYINRTVGLLFRDDFFIEKVTWKPEHNRACIKTSSILCCWKESHGKKFPEDIDNQRFIKHFRRIKSAKRAAIKAKTKKELDRIKK